MNLAAVYCRLGSDFSQKGGATIDEQVAGCRAYCQRHGMHVAHMAIEFENTAHVHDLIELGQRNGMRVVHMDTDVENTDINALIGLEMLVRPNDFSHLVVYSVNRLSGNVAHDIAFAQKLTHRGIRLHSVTESVDNTTSAGMLDLVKLLNAAALKERPVTDSEGKIMRFVRLCRTPGTSLAVLNEALREISNCNVPIEFDDGDSVRTELTYANIANVLNDYSVKRRDGSAWTAANLRNARIKFASVAGTA
jgi:hypothetical protein